MILKVFYNSKKKHNYQKEEIEEGEAQDVDRSCKGLRVRIRTCARYVICRKCGTAGKIRKKLKIRTSFVKRQDDTSSISQGRTQLLKFSSLEMQNRTCIVFTGARIILVLNVRKGREYRERN